jgi:osmoprotectant transport system ATP-binding protein
MAAIERCTAPPADREAPVVITFENVSKRYPDGTVALDDLSLECLTGKTTVFVGTSGSGKTTAVRMINRLVEPTSGRILIDGEDVRSRPAAQLRRGIGYVIQQVGLFPHRTIVDNIATVPYLVGWDKKRARARALELMETVGLPSAMAKRYPYQLSGGQQQRVGVARALAADPPILLMDEPFSAVDPVVRSELQQEFLRIRQELEKTIVFVTHDIDEAIKLGDRIAVLRIGGKLVQFATPEHLLAEPADDFVESFLGYDRGFRRLSFFEAKALSLREPKTVIRGATTGVGGVPESGSTAGAGPATSSTGGEPVLVVDEDRRPVGWAPNGDLNRRPLPIGHSFRPDRDSMRAALDAAVLSPVGIAVGVDADGAVVGVADQAEISATIRAFNDEQDSSD